MEQLIKQWGSGAYIFNLGRVVPPDPLVEHVEQVVGRGLEHG